MRYKIVEISEVVNSDLDLDNDTESYGCLCIDCMYSMFKNCYLECTKSYLPSPLRYYDHCSRGELKENKKCKNQNC